MNKNEHEAAEIHDPSAQVDLKWSAQFDRLLNTISSRLSQYPAPRVQEHQDRTIPPEELCTPEDGKKFDESIGRDFFRLVNGKPHGQFRFRLISWHPQWVADSTIANGFRARCYVEKFRFLPEGLSNGRRTRGINEERPREIFEAGYFDCKIFLRDFVACSRELSPEELESRL